MCILLTFRSLHRHLFQFPAIYPCSPEVAAIASRDINKAKEWAEANDVPQANLYGSYQELIDDGGIDAIYCPLPSGLHLEWVEKIVRAGKHLLLEKPIANCREDLDKMLTALASCGVQFMDGEWVELVVRV